jgi:YidC/Oxa1 family membrane protein insertase
MEKRIILAFVLSFIALYAFRALFLPPAPSEPPATAPTPASATQPPTAGASSEKAPGPKAAPKHETEEVAPVTESVAENVEDVTLDTSLYSAIFSNQGASLKSFRLKQYSDGSGNPLELINQEASSKVGWPLALTTGDKALDEQLQAGKYRIRRDGNTLVFEFAANGVHARKVLEFDSENYQFTFQASVSKDGKAIPYAVTWQGGFGDQSIPQDPAKKNAVYQSDSSFKRIAVRSLKDQPQNITTPRAGVEDQYFLAMFGAVDSVVPVKVGKQEFPGKDGKPIPTLNVAATVPQGSPLRVYVGPKQRDWLSKADPQLSAVLDYGYFEFIAKPLVFCLLWIHSYIGNFGWSIILLTVVINLILFPLRLKQQVAMLKMQKIQPQMRRLQDQYKKLKANDPRKTEVQSQMMGLYKEHGVNPMGGCLPLLLQMPLLFGFYSALAYSIELRRAPWIFWIKDLSQADPYYVIPILMAVAMIIQQKLTPTANMDPAQARMMMLMPIMMTFLFLAYASGLALYWLTGSVIGVAQQVFINKYWSPRAEGKLTRSRPSEPRGA